MRKILIGLLAVGFVGVGVGLWTSLAAEEEHHKEGDASCPNSHCSRLHIDASALLESRNV